MRRSIVVAALLLVASAVVGGTLPDLTTGNVDGHVGLLYWPAQLPDPVTHQPRPLASAAACTVRMVLLPDHDREIGYDCGKWFTPRLDGRYNFWLETDGAITPVVSMVTFAVRPFAGKGAGAIVPLAPAGKIVLPRAIADTEDLRVLSLSAVHSWQASSRVFDRRVKAADAQKPVQMPEGRVVVGRFDHATGNAVALSPVLDLKAGRVTEVWPAEPVTSDVLVVLDKPGEMQTSKPLDVAIALDKRPPDAMLNALERVIAIWYAVDARTATLSLQSKEAFLAPRELRLTRGKVTTLRANLAPLPKLNVSINAPPDFSAALQVAGRSIPVNSGVHRIDDLPAEPLQVTLKIGDWKLTRGVDLSSGEDGAVTFDVEPIAINGTVYYGDDRAAADLEFWRGGDEWVKLPTDERGDYATTLWWPDEQHVRIRLRDGAVPPFMDPFRSIMTSGRVDFHVPRTDYAVRVRDAKTGKAIDGALVNVGSVWADERGGQQSERVITDANGKAILPPVRKGELILEARAEHYAASQPLRLTVDDEHHELDIALEPLRESATLQLLLPNAMPATGADVWAFDASMHPLWRGTAGEDGSIALPDLARGALLLVRHANAASTIRPWINDEKWTLDAPADPLTIVAGRAGVPIALILDDVRIAGPPLSFATWSNPGTTGDGAWTGRNLPRRAATIYAGADAHAIDYPWSGAIRISSR